MRVIRSLTGAADVSKATADAIERALETGRIVRESYEPAPPADKDYWFRVVEYRRSQNGPVRYAVVCDEPADCEIHDSASQAEAEKFYEDRVRSTLADLGWQFAAVDFPL